MAEGFRGIEGPIVLPDGSYAVTDGDGIARVTPDGETSTLATCGGDPNGLALAPDGTILVANNGLVCRPGKVPGSVQRVTPDGAVETLAGGLDAPNDITVAPDGSVWFTDPRVCILDESDRRPGRVLRLDGEPAIMHEGLAFPNGIGFHPDGRLVVAATRSGTLHAFDDRAPAVWVRLPEGSPDGFTFAADGTGFVCCYDVATIFVIDRSGAVIDELHTERDTWPTNCVLTPDGRLLVTESRHGRLLAFEVGVTP